MAPNTVNRSTGSAAGYLSLKDLASPILTMALCAQNNTTTKKSNIIKLETGTINYFTNKVIATVGYLSVNISGPKGSFTLCNL